MLKVLPVRDKEKQREYCALCALEYDPDLMCYAAHEDDTFLGISLFHIEDKVGVLDRVKLKDSLCDELALYLLAKAPLNFVDLCGIHTAVFRDPDKELARKLEFIEKDGVFTVDLTNYFTSPCSRHKESNE